MKKLSTYKDFIIKKSIWLQQFADKPIGIILCENIFDSSEKLFVGNVPEGDNDEWTDICYIIDNGRMMNKKDFEII